MRHAALEASVGGGDGDIIGIARHHQAPRRLPRHGVIQDVGDVGEARVIIDVVGPELGEVLALVDELLGELQDLGIVAGPFPSVADVVHQRRKIAGVVGTVVDDPSLKRTQPVANRVAHTHGGALRYAEAQQVVGEWVEPAGA